MSILLCTGICPQQCITTNCNVIALLFCVRSCELVRGKDTMHDDVIGKLQGRVLLCPVKL